MADDFISLNPKRDVALFDLDGTVLDTYEPILVSMRYATEKVFGKALPLLSFDLCRLHIVGGTDADVCRRPWLRPRSGR